MYALGVIFAGFWILALVDGAARGIVLSGAAISRVAAARRGLGRHRAPDLDGAGTQLRQDGPVTVGPGGPLGPSSVIVSVTASWSAATATVTSVACARVPLRASPSRSTPAVAGPRQRHHGVQRAFQRHLGHHPEPRGQLAGHLQDAAARPGPAPLRRLRRWSGAAA